MDSKTRAYEYRWKMRKISLLIGLLLIAGSSNADTIFTNDGKEIKGIVVEDYKDRLVFSTADGEITIMKADIKELYFDTEEDNLIKLAEQARDRHDYVTSFTYYVMASKLNPDSKAAKDGMVFLQGYLFRKEEAKKEDEIKKREEFERYGSAVFTDEADERKKAELTERLKDVFGMTLSIKGNVPEIENVQYKSSAFDAGVRKGDRLVAVWGRLTGYTPLKEVMENLLEKSSSEIKCVIERPVEVNISPERNILSGPNNLIGASFSMEFDGLTISNVIEGSSGFQAGLKTGDIITAIDDKSVRYTPLKKAVEMIRNSKNNSVTLTIRRDMLIWRRG